MPTPQFAQQNLNWNAEPNAPDPQITFAGDDLQLRFFLNAFAFEEFHAGELGILRFENVAKYRLGRTNDEGWYRGHCRFSGLAPAWGEFYSVNGAPTLLDAPTDWHLQRGNWTGLNHFLFYFRDQTFECVARRWAFAQSPGNALLRLKQYCHPRACPHKAQDPT
jgi:hypothetical protein